MSGFGQDAWLAAGHSLLTEKIPAEAYMDVLKERQKVYSQTCGKEIPWIVALIEWFCWPDDNDFVILPDRTTAQPRTTRTDADRLADAEASAARWTGRLAKAEASLSAAILRALPDTEDTAVINVKRSPKAWKRLDSDLSRVAQAEKLRRKAKDALTMARARVRKYGGVA